MKMEVILQCSNPGCGIEFIVDTDYINTQSEYIMCPLCGELFINRFYEK